VTTEGEGGTLLKGGSSRVKELKTSCWLWGKLYPDRERTGHGEKPLLLRNGRTEKGGKVGGAYTKTNPSRKPKRGAYTRRKKKGSAEEGHNHKQTRNTIGTLFIRGKGHAGQGKRGGRQRELITKTERKGGRQHSTERLGQNPFF